MKITPIKQSDESACGPTSIKMAADYLDLEVSMDHIATVSKYVKKDGLSNQDLVDTVKRIGLSVRSKANAKWADLRQANSQKNVIIVSWMKYGYMGHFSVVDTVEKDHIILADPENGKMEKMEKIIFMRLWMDYDDMWYPSKNTDIQLRWMCVVSKKHGIKKA